MTCPNCNAHLRDDASICLSCGEMVRRRIASSDRLQAAPAGVPAWIAFDAPPATEGTLFPASRVQRIVAALVDSTVLALVAAGLTLVLGEPAEVSGDIAASARPEFTLNWVPFVLLVVVSAMYHIVFPATKWRATPGKKLLGLQIVNLEHEQVTMWQSAARWFCFQVCWLIVFPLAALVALYGCIAVPVAFLILMGNGRSPWDWMAGTKVVD